MARHFRLLNGPSPAFERLYQIFEEAQRDGKGLIFVKDHAAITDDEREEALAEEVNHAYQGLLGPLSKHLGVWAKPFLALPVAANIVTYLRTKLEYDFRGQDHLAALEVGEKLMRPNAYKELGISKSERDSLATTTCDSWSMSMGNNKPPTSSPAFARPRALRREPAALAEAQRTGGELPELYPALGTPLQVDPKTGKVSRQPLASDPAMTTTPTAKTPSSAQPTTHK